LKFAAIDIGSNAVRLLFCNVFEGNIEPVFKKAELIRVPIRLGEDSFLLGKISEEKADKLVSAMKAFKNLISVYDAIDYRACATSAMRDASNNKELLERIRNEAGIDVELIDGKTEANIIYSNHIAEHLDENSAYLYIDVGGGSTELTLFADKKVIASRSFNIGTIRVLHEQIDKTHWIDLKDWVKTKTDNHHPLVAIGSGGNINKLYKMSERKENKPLSYNRLKDMYDDLKNYTFEERVTILGLNPDRADVIIPAAKIVLTVMKNADIEKIIVPQIGLSDGIVHQLYEAYRNKKLARQLSVR
jgi:exopolyphosphatase / guanosine-5'-triphosphate,3'-diphosphate pyrophosphatase